MTALYSQPTDTRHFNRVAWITLVLALSLILLSLAQKIYRLTLPTDGWAFITGEIGGPDQDRPTYTRNLINLPSPLQPGDRFLAVEDLSFETIAANVTAAQGQSLPRWQVGQIVQYTVERNDQPVSLDVPLYSWPIQLVMWGMLTNLSLWTALLLAVVGCFVFLKRPNEWAAHPLLLFSICLLANNISTAVVDWGLPELLTPAILPVAIFFSNWIFAVVMFPSLLLLTLLFPRPKGLVQHHPRLVLALLYGLVPLLIVTFGSIATIGWVSVLTMALLSLVALGHSFFTMRDPIGRAQMRWAVGGLVVMVLGFIPINLSGLGWLPFPFPLWLEEIWFPMMLIFMALGFGVAILRYRLFDIDIIINRALVYGTLTASVVAIYVFVVGYLGAVFRIEGHLLISLAATGVAAVLFHPLREWLQRGVNRLLYGQRDDPVAVLTQLGQRLETTITPEEMLPGLVETVAHTLKLPYAAIALKTEQRFEVRAESGQATADLQAFPLNYQGEAVGELRVAPRAPGEAFNPTDRLLLENIARQAGAAAHAVRLTADLQRSRQELVTTREAERRRLRRDLHDGLGPQLASQTLTIDAIGRQLEKNPAVALELLQHLKEQTQAAVKDIRRLVYGLRPPALDELGLVESFRAQADEYKQVGIRLTITVMPTPLPMLPAAVEVAVYRIVQEAIANVAHHALATCCTIQITVQANALQLTIGDDGQGLPTTLRYGVGLNSMRERAEELGGTISIENQTKGGVRVNVQLPLPGEII